MNTNSLIAAMILESGKLTITIPHPDGTIETFHKVKVTPDLLTPGQSL